MVVTEALFVATSFSRGNFQGNMFEYKAYFLKLIETLALNACV